MTTSELKARMQSIINNEDFDFRQIALRAILADLEASELRKCPKCGNEDEPLQACDHCGHTWYTTSKLDRGIERAEPPKPTGEQLKAIGKILDGDAPRECKKETVFGWKKKEMAYYCLVAIVSANSGGT